MLPGPNAGAAPIPSQALVLPAAEAPSLIKAQVVIDRRVYPRRAYRYRPGYGYRVVRPHRRVSPGAAAAAGITGAIIGGALSAAEANARNDEWIAYCARKYKSFDPASGTYLGYDGQRHACR
jgi:hypothetical protein